MEEGTNSHYYKEQAQNVCKYFKIFAASVIFTCCVWLCRAWRRLIFGWEPERVTALSTFVIFLATVATVCVGIAQWRALHSTDEATRDLAKAALKQAETTENTLIATQRPWIAIKSITITSPLAFEPTSDDHEGRIELGFLVRNTGNSPAIRVAANMQLVVSFDLRESQRIFCDGIRKSREDATLNPRILQPEVSLFPGNEGTMQAVAWMAPDPLARWREYASKNPNHSVNASIVGCIFYEFTFAKSHHQTGVIYDLYKQTPYPEKPVPDPYLGTVLPYVPGAIRLEGTIPSDDLSLRQNIVGSGPID